MTRSFADNFTLILKALSLSRASVAAQLGVNKSVVTRWASGATAPSAHNLARLSALMAQSVAGFSALDWDLDPPAFAERLGVGASRLAQEAARTMPAGLALPFWDQIKAATALRGRAYEGLWRSTRPYPGYPGSYVHDHCLVRLGPEGLLRLTMESGGVRVEGWVLPLNGQLYVIGSEFTSGAMAFGLLHGVNSLDAEVLDGLLLVPSLDIGRTPSATGVVFERVRPLGDDAQNDEAWLQEASQGLSVASSESVPEDLRRHLAHNQRAAPGTPVGDGVLRAPLERTLSRGPRPRLG